MERMKIVNQGGWVYYLGEDYKTLDKQKSVKTAVKVPEQTRREYYRKQLSLKII